MKETKLRLSKEELDAVAYELGYEPGELSDSDRQFYADEFGDLLVELDDISTDCVDTVSKLENSSFYVQEVYKRLIELWHNNKRPLSGELLDDIDEISRKLLITSGKVAELQDELVSIKSRFMKDGRNLLSFYK